MGNVSASINAGTELPATGRVSAGWRLVAAVFAYCLIAGLLFHQTVMSIVMIWMRSQTYAHGFLILPIVLWLLWRQRGQFAAAISQHPQSVRPQPWALLLLVGGGLVWFLAHLVDVLIIQQLAFVGIIITGVWSIVGTTLALRAAFPLFYLFLAVPMGASLIPPLMELTADTTEFMLRSSGIPVYREGMYLILPTGIWSVVEECSGLRYLIASVTLGTLYAYLTYTSLWRRLAFVAAAIVVPIAANSLRAYIVVALGHFSNMHIAAGDDHLVYGWILFGLVLLLMFWIGGKWRQEPVNLAEPQQTASGSTPGAPLTALTLCTVLTIIAAGLWPVLAQTMNRSTTQHAFAPLTLPGPAAEWQTADNRDWHWQPTHQGADRELDQVYASRSSQGLPETRPVALFLRQHLQRVRDIKLVNSADPWRPDRDAWWVVARGTTRIDLGFPVQVNETIVMSEQQRVLIWSWYRIGGHYTSNPYTGKLLEARQHIVDGGRSGTRMFIATPVADDPALARKTLQTFINHHRAAIEAALDDGQQAMESQ